MHPKDKRSFLSLLFVVALDNFGFGVVFILFAPLLLSGDYGMLPADMSLAAKNIYLGVLFAVFPLAQFFGAPIFGDYADNAGRKKALYITIIGTVIGYILSGFTIFFTSIWGLIISRLLTGFFSGNLSICLAGIADLSPTESLRSRNFAILTVVWGISWPFAMLAGGYLANPSISPFFNPMLPFWVTAFLSAVSLIAVVFFFIETHERREKIPFNLIKGIHHVRDAIKLKSIRTFLFVVFFWTLGWGLGIQWFSTYSILEFKVSQVAVTWGLIGQGLFWMIGGSFINPLLLKRFKSLEITIIGFIFAAIFLFISSLFHTFILFTSFYSTAAIFGSFSFSNAMNLVSINAPEKIQGKVMGFTQSLSSLGWVFVPVIGGLVGGTNPRLFYPLATLLFSCGLILLLVYKRKMRSA